MAKANWLKVDPSQGSGNATTTLSVILPRLTSWRPRRKLMPTITELVILDN